MGVDADVIDRYLSEIEQSDFIILTNNTRFEVAS
jgi:hypothetical protein